MDRSHTQSPQQSTLPTFNKIFLDAQFPRAVVTTILSEINAPQFVLHEMIAGNPVAPQDADAILKVVSQHAGKEWTRENVQVPVLPTGAEILAGEAGGEA